MTPPDPQQVAEIAGRLSKAQREALATLSRRPLRPKASGSALLALCRRGLAQNRISVFGGNVWSATVIGLAVRNFIQGNSHD